MLSIFSPHFFNWTEQLKDSGHEVYWLDVFDSNTKVEKIDFVRQIIGWRYKWNYPGRYLVKQKLPFLNKFINKINERDLAKVFEQKLQEIQPDVVHSFVMYLSAAPIFPVMKKFPKIKWIYSSWGSDLFYYRNQEKEHARMKEAFPRIDYMFADCYRDYKIAKEKGFKSEFLGVFPGRGGYDLTGSNAFLQPYKKRNLILIKGYQGKHGKCIEVLRSLLNLEKELKRYKIIIFGTAPEVEDFVLDSPLKNWENFKALDFLPHSQVLELMGKSFLFIGNSTSDGIPNTLLEAIIMGVFPIQSNPGGATAEIIENGINGSLIKNPTNSEEIAVLIRKTINNPEMLRSGIEYNTKNIKPTLERGIVKEAVLQKYKLVENNLNN